MPLWSSDSWQPIGPEDAGADGKKSLGAWIAATVKFDGVITVEDVRRKQIAFLKKLVAHDGDAPAFWNDLRNDELLRAEVGKLQLSLQLGVLTQQDVALTRAVQDRYHPTSLRDLVKVTETEWQSVLQESNAAIPDGVEGATPEVRRRIYAATLAGLLQLALPVETTAHAIARMNPEHWSGERIRDGVARFLVNVSNDELKQRDLVFDLATSHINEFVEEHGEAAYAGITEEEREKVLEGVKRVQRLKTLPNWSELFGSLELCDCAALPIGSEPRRVLRRYPSFPSAGATERRGQDSV